MKVTRQDYAYHIFLTAFFKQYACYIQYFFHNLVKDESLKEKIYSQNKKKWTFTI